MLIYLDSESNRKAHPNENFARELMELFCLGEGHYSERDVQELARCFTGWEIRNGRFRKNRYQQDTESKSFLGKSGVFDGEQAVEIVVNHPQSANFVVGKLYKYLVCDEPEPASELLQPLANTLRQSSMQIRPVVRQILCSNWFYSPQCLARKIRSPVELAIGLIRTLEISANTVAIAKDLLSVGQGLFYPPNVKGWDGSRAWINSSTLLGRANMLQSIVFDEKTRFAGEKLTDYLAQVKVFDVRQAVAFFCRQMMAPPVSDAKQMQVVELAQASGDREMQMRRALHGVCVLPEFQIG